jgi:hypothetical protein
LASADRRHLVATGAAFSKVGDAAALRAGNVDIAFIKTNVSLGFRRYA